MRNKFSVLRINADTDKNVSQQTVVYLVITTRTNSIHKAFTDSIEAMEYRDAEQTAEDNVFYNRYSPAELTVGSFILLTDLMDDAGDWNGTPMIDVTKEQRGNLSHLKRKGYITTFTDEGIAWADFTDKGKELADKMGYELS